MLAVFTRQLEVAVSHNASSLPVSCPTCWHTVARDGQTAVRTAQGSARLTFHSAVGDLESMAARKARACRAEPGEPYQALVLA